jgi:RHS repeat-associated protein
LRYKTYGETRYTDGTTPTTYKFTGQRLDDSTGLYYYGARYYDPALGRFIQPDAIVAALARLHASGDHSLKNPLAYLYDF